MKKKYRSIHGAKMVPTGLVTCLVNGTQVRILELSLEAMVLRLADKVNSMERLQVNFFHFKESRYEEILVESYELEEITEQEDYYTYTLRIDENDYCQQVGAVLRDYTEYIELKMSGDDGYCSEEKVGYPAEKDEEFYSDFEEQKKEWFETLDGGQRNHVWTSEYELAMGIDNQLRYQQYLSLGMVKYKKALMKENHLLWHPLAEKAIQRIYIGNQFCHNLFPNEQQLFQLLQKAYDENLAITVVTSYLREEFIPDAQRMVADLYEWSRQHQTKIELVANDWGMLSLLEEKQDWIEPVLGILLNKRRKDPRYTYKAGFDQYVLQLARNSVNGETYRKFLKESMGITRYEFEGCGYPMELPESKSSLHIPYFQTNTSQYCTLYAKCAYHDRGKQELVHNCPYYCEEVIFAYPKHLKMVGRYNSLFGMDDSILRDGQILQSYLAQGLDRLVLTLL